jgi:hypothetical protein
LKFALVVRRIHFLVGKQIVLLNQIWRKKLMNHFVLSSNMQHVPADVIQVSVGALEAEFVFRQHKVLSMQLGQFGMIMFDGRVRVDGGDVVEAELTFGAIVLLLSLFTLRFVNAFSL